MNRMPHEIYSVQPEMVMTQISGAFDGLNLLASLDQLSIHQEVSLLEGYSKKFISYKIFNTF